VRWRISLARPARYVTREFPPIAPPATCYRAGDSAFRAATGWTAQVSLEDGIWRSLEWFRRRLTDDLPTIF
jgi:hypothetical protein